MKTGIELITKERQEQIKKHGRSLNYDVRFNTNDQLMNAVRQMINNNPDRMANALSILSGSKVTGFTTPPKWDIDIFSKMIGKPYKERLIIAGALIAAEIDRLQNLNPTNQE